MRSVIAICFFALVVPIPAALGQSSTAPTLPGININAETIMKQLKTLAPTEVTVDDPVYKTKKHYEAYQLSHVLSSTGLYIPNNEVSSFVVVFHCKDGYSPSIPLSQALRGNAFLADRDLLAEPGARWQPFQQGKKLTTPDPLFLVWINIDVADPKYPWPYQIDRIEITPRARESVAHSSVNKAVYNGRMLFEMHCLRCHSVNLSGGTLGPELNVPKNVTEYWQMGTLRAFIQDARSFHAHSQMPSFQGVLTPKEVNEIISYLRRASLEKCCTTTSACAKIQPR